MTCAPAWERLRFYLPFLWRFAVLSRPEPLVYGIAVTDRCNLSCQGCRVSNTGRPDMSWDSLVATMRDAWRRGFRDLYFSGGEPMLWRDGERTLEDAVAEARRIGFFHVHVYTNGTLGLKTSADLVWVSMDGLPETFKVRRGDHFERVEAAIRGSGSLWGGLSGRILRGPKALRGLKARPTSVHPKVAVIYVIDRDTAAGVELFLEWVRSTRLPVIGVMFYFHTPYYARDRLFLTADERAPIIDRLLACVRQRLPVLNSRAGLVALKSGGWPRRTPSARVADVDGEYICCRAADDVCQDCGYAACTEITESQRLRPSALAAMRRYW